MTNDTQHGGDVEHEEGMTVKITRPKDYVERTAPVAIAAFAGLVLLLSAGSVAQYLIGNTEATLRYLTQWLPLSVTAVALIWVTATSVTVVYHVVVKRRLVQR